MILGKSCRYCHIPTSNAQCKTKVDIEQKYPRCTMRVEFGLFTMHENVFKVFIGSH